jgi:hypothetical protein
MKLDLNLLKIMRNALEQYEEPKYLSSATAPLFPSSVLPQACQRAAAIVALAALQTRQEAFPGQQMLAKEYHKTGGLSTL